MISEVLQLLSFGKYLKERHLALVSNMLWRKIT